MRESKECLECGGIYFRPEKATNLMWAARKYCSASCGGKALARRHQKVFAGKPLSDEEVVHANRIEAELEDEASHLLGPILPPDPVAAQSFKPREPVMRDLKIVRVGPNPTLLFCEYFELAERRTCTVRVKRTGKFVRGMKLKMPEPVDELEIQRPWVYAGPAPKHRGRW